MIEIPQSVKDAYNEPHRKYHNRDHIESILGKIPLFRTAYHLGEIATSKLEIIAWYHDVVYAPGDPGNEPASGLRLEEDVIRGLVGPWEDDSLYEMAHTVFRTKVHTQPVSWVCAIFFDLDLADMGTGSYVENSYKIREEFKDFSDLEWLAGRKKFLNDFLSRPFIYHTSLGYKLWEDKARLNMEKELSFLEGKYGK